MYEIQGINVRIAQMLEVSLGTVLLRLERDACRW